MRACVHSVGMLCGYMPNSSFEYMLRMVFVLIHPRGCYIPIKVVVVRVYRYTVIDVVKMLP